MKKTTSSSSSGSGGKAAVSKKPDPLNDAKKVLDDYKKLAGVKQDMVETLTAFFF